MGAGGVGRWRQAIWVIGLIAALLVAGCSDERPSQPERAESTGLSLPPRPRDLRIDGVDPCSLLTDRQRAELGLDGQPAWSRQPSALFRGEESLCLYTGYTPRAVFVGVGTVTTADVGSLLDSQLEATLSNIDVQGFPAVRAIPRQFTKFCSVFIDVGPGQLIDVQFSDGGRKPPIMQDRLCADAELVATTVMGNLLRR